MQPLPHILACEAPLGEPVKLESRPVADLRKAATFWLVPNANKLSREQCVVALRRALHDDETARQVVAGLNQERREVLAAYARYGGAADGEVIRLDLLQRGLLVRKFRDRGYGSRWAAWQSNPIDYLAERWALLVDQPHEPYRGYFSSYGYHDQTEQPFADFHLQAGLAKVVTPAGPPPPLLHPLKGEPHPLGRRTSAEVALDLSRVLSVVTSGVRLKLTKAGDLSVPGLRALAKAAPFAADGEFPLPDPQAFYLGLLHALGLVQTDKGELAADETVAARQFALPTPWQAHLWVHAWMNAWGWEDGRGHAVSSSGYGEDESARWNTLGRVALAWALAGLAHATSSDGESAPWFELNAFIAALFALQGKGRTCWGYGWEYAWQPTFPTPTEGNDYEQREAGSWLKTRGTWYANAVMISLVALGLVERGRLGEGKQSPLCFRLTELGLAVFGAPEVKPAPTAAGQRCLVVQPNFDIVAYMDRADAAAAGTLGRVADPDKQQSGPVQNFRLTRASVCRALESGLDVTGVLGFLKAHNQGELPANIERSVQEWAARREALVVRQDVTVRGFPSAAKRDAWLAEHSGTACGERFVIEPSRGHKKVQLRSGLLVDHTFGLRGTLHADEHGRITSRQPFDLVQRARLARLADRTDEGWRLTPASLGRASAAGVKRDQARLWLQQHMAEPMPGLIEVALDACLGKLPPLELGQAVLLCVPVNELFEALTTSERLRPYFCGCPGPGWLLVRQEKATELAAVLTELGFPLMHQLTMSADNRSAPV